MNNTAPPMLHLPAPPRPSLWHRFLKFCWWLLILAAVGSSAIALGIIGWLVFSWQVEGRILPGVQVLGIPLAGHTAESAAVALAEAWPVQTILLQTPSQSFTATPAELGFALDTAATAQAAAAWSQNADWTAVWEFWWSGAAVSPVWRVDVAQTEAYLNQIAPAVAVDPLNAGVRFDTASGRLVATPSAVGQQLDVAATRDWVVQQIDLLGRTGQLPLVLLPVPPALASTEELVAATNAQLAAELTIPLFDPILGQREAVSLPPSAWGNWLAPQTIAQEVNWGVNEAAVLDYVNQHMGQWGDERYLDAEETARYIGDLITAHMAQTAAPTGSVRIYHGGRQHVVQAGETFSSIARDYGMPYPWLQQANPGVDALAVGQLLAVPSADDFLPLPVVENKRLVISISEQRLWAYEDGQQVWEWVISTGIAASPTAPGVYQVRSHEDLAYAGNWDLWMPNFMGIYQPVPGNEFMNGFHGFPSRNGQQLLWTNSLGTPVTYGCILVGDEQMAALYTWAEEGVVVEVRP